MMSNDTPGNDPLSRAQRLTAEIGTMIQRSNAAIERTHEAIRRAWEASQADAALARLIDATKSDADDGSARA